MPFRSQGAVALTERIDVRLSPAEKEELRAVATAAGMPVSELVRRRSLGRPVIARTDITAIRELRRLGGLVKKVYLDSRGAYREATARALAALTDAVVALARGG